MTRSGSAVLDRLTTFASDGRTPVLATLAVGWFCTVGMRLVYPVLVPHIRADFGLSNTTAGFLYTAIMLTYAATQFPAGILADVVGERRILLASVVGTVVGICLLATAPVLAVLLLGCLSFGLGSGLFAPPMISTLSKVFPERSGTAVGLVFAAGSVGTTVLPVVAGFVGVRFGWRAGFGFVLPVLGLAVAGIATLVPADGAGRRAESTQTGDATDTASPDTTNLAPPDTPDTPDTASPDTASPDTPDTASPDSTDATESTSSTSIRSVLRDIVSGISRSEILLVAGSTLLLSVAYQALSSFYPTYLIEVKGVTPELSTLVFGVFFFGGLLWQVGAGTLADRWSIRGIMAIIAGLCGVSIFGLTLVSGLVPVLAVTLLFSSISGFISLTNTFLVSALPEDVQGSGLGLLRSVFIGIGSLSPLLVGSLADAGRFDFAFVLMAGFATAAAAVLVYALSATPDSRGVSS